MKIVVGYDGSEAAKRGLERAAQIAGDQSEVVVVAVAEPYPRSGITIPANRDPEEIARRRDDLDEARRYLSSGGIIAVVGSGRLNRLQRLLLGSVSSQVVHEAACDVLVVR